MIIVREHEGTIARVDGNPVIVSVGGQRKAPLQTILAPNWTEYDRAAFGIYIAEPFVAPEGQVATGPEYFVRDGVVVWQMFDVMDQPPPSAEMINAERDRRVESGFYFNDVLFQSRVEDQKRINGAGTLAAIAVMNGAQPGEFRWHGGDNDFAWISADNQLVLMDAFNVIEFGQAAARWESAHVFAARLLKDMAEPPQDYTNDQYWPKHG